MALVSWSPDLSVGISAIDTQHKQLIDLINQLHEAMRVGKGQIELYSILDQLVKYTETHFADEEKMLQEAGYREYYQHKGVHENLTKQVRDLRSQLNQGQIGLSIKVSDFLKTWLTSHIKGVDMKYKEHMQRITS